MRENKLKQAKSGAAERVSPRLMSLLLYSHPLFNDGTTFRVSCTPRNAVNLRERERNHGLMDVARQYAKTDA